MTPPRQIAHIAIAVRSLTDALGFYRDTLGLEVSEIIDSPERGLRIAILPCGEAVLELVMSLDVVKKDSMVLNALKNRQQHDSTHLQRSFAHPLGQGYGYGWTAPIGLSYAVGSTLHHHIDGHGRWVVLFSFGLTCDFHAAGRTVTIESGDALVFNGGAAHAVMHGLDKVHAQPSLNGNTKALPAGMLDKLNNCRVSVQVRQV